MTKKSAINNTMRITYPPTCHACCLISEIDTKEYNLDDIRKLHRILKKLKPEELCEFLRRLRILKGERPSKNV